MNHYQHEIDTLLLEGASIIIATKFKQVLNSFLDASEKDINNKKCQFYGWNTSPRIMRSIAQVFRSSLVENWTVFRYHGILITLISSYT
jgi:hypothetical protein